jgi:RimJ/RimL family protein N-acetyltransferase
VEIKCATGNIQSQKVPVRLHFELEGVLRQAEFHSKGFHDLNLYAMLRSEWYL